MNHWENVLLKMVLNGIVAIPLLMWFTGDTFTNSAVTAVLLSIVAYIGGDLLILRNTNNTIASISDFGLSYLFIWATSMMMYWPLTYTEIFWVALAITVTEVWYHYYLQRRWSAAR